MMAMSPRLIAAYFGEIERLESLEQLRNISAACAPNMEPRNRDEMIRSLKSRFQPEQKFDRVLSLEDIARGA